jgi:hypothetical protein
MANITSPGRSRGEQVVRFNEFAINTTVSSMSADTSSNSGTVDVLHSSSIRYIWK